MEPPVCQSEELTRFSEPVSRPGVALLRVEWHLKNRGFLGVVRALPGALARRVRRAIGLAGKRPAPGTSSSEETLNLRPGEIVEVRSEEEIRRSLDASGRHRGLSFPSGMTAFCGRRMRVLKRVERICVDEKPGEIRRLRHTVLLEGAICTGNGLTAGCDRSCYFFWREAWLKRVDPS